LNNLPENLANNLPKNDSRFRLDMRFLELGDDLKKAQLYKNAYEQKQREEIPDEGHKVLFFDEKINSETDSSYYEPNGKYWEMKKNGSLKNNANANIFQVENYVKEMIEKEKQTEMEKEKEKGKKEDKEESKKENQNEAKIEEKKDDKKDEKKVEQTEVLKEEKDKKENI